MTNNVKSTIENFDRQFQKSTLLNLVPYAMLVILFSIILMAVYSKRNVHPDEYVHLNAAFYYQNHTLPPKACSEDALNTYSVYGFSRLDKYEIAYFLNGKFLNLVQPLPLYGYIQARFFNIALFFILTLMAIKIVNFRLFALPLIISPQFWYLFSYTNSEPFSIFISLISAYLLLDKQSLFYKTFSTTQSFIKKLFGGIALALVATGLLFVKETFFIFSGYFLFFALLFKHYKLLFNGKAWQLIKCYKKLLFFVSALTIALSALWILPHEWVNDFQRTENMNQCRLETAKKAYSPATPLNETIGTIYLKDKGYPISSLLENGWHERVFYSSFGYFGYSAIPASIEYYSLIGISMVALLLLLSISTVYVYKDDKNKYPLIIILLSIVLFAIIDAASLYKCWTGDFQPQGRYFFSIIVMLGCLIFSCKQTLLKRELLRQLIMLVAGIMFVLSLFCFTFVGFTEIPKLIGT